MQEGKQAGKYELSLKQEFIRPLNATKA